MRIRFRFSDAAVAQRVYCSRGKMHWIIHSLEKWQTRDISQDFSFAESKTARSSSRGRLWNRFSKKIRHTGYAQPPLCVRGIIQTAPCRLLWSVSFRGRSFPPSPLSHIHPLTRQRARSLSTLAREKTNGGVKEGDRQVTQERGRPYSNASGANRARRWGIYIGFSQRDSDLLGIRPPVSTSLPPTQPPTRPFVSPFSASLRSSSNSLSCLSVPSFVSSSLFANLWLLPLAPSSATSWRHRNHRGKPNCSPRCRSNKSRADPRQLLGRNQGEREFSRPSMCVFHTMKIKETDLRCLAMVAIEHIATYE